MNLLTYYRIVEMYHGATPETDRTRIVQGYTEPNSTTRLLLATVAFGMGVDIPNIRIVVNWGLPNSVMQYWQEVCSTKFFSFLVPNILPHNVFSTPIPISLNTIVTIH